MTKKPKQSPKIKKLVQIADTRCKKKGQPGPPEKLIDWDEVDRLMIAGSNQERIAGRIGVHPDTLRDRLQAKYGVEYSIYSTAKKRAGDSLLEAAQFKKAMTGNTTMLMWLGKVRLGQREPEVEKSRPPNDDQLDLFLNKVKDPDNALEVDKDK